MHKIMALCLLIRTETLQNATAGRGRRRLQEEGCGRLLQKATVGRGREQLQSQGER